jgi:molybdenum cofactor cytidylyltransferase
LNYEKNIFLGLLLAAGESSRMNEWKPAVLINDKPILYHSLDLLLCFCKNVIVVGGYNFSGLENLISLGKYEERVLLVENKSYSNGMLSSVQAGLMGVEFLFDGLFIMPADMPFVRKATCEKLTGEMLADNENDVFIPAVEIAEKENTRLKKGHPVLIKQKCVDFIKNYDNRGTLRDVLKELKIHISAVNDYGILFDVDEQADLEKAINFQY